jgi:hypothetical protein
VAQDQLLEAKHGVEALVLTAHARDASEFDAGAQKIRLYVTDMGTNVDDEPALSRYLYEQTAAYLSAQVHLEVRQEAGIDVDSVLEQHVVATRDLGGARTALVLVAIVKNAKSGAVIAGSTFPIAQLPQSAGSPRRKRACASRRTTWASTSRRSSACRPTNIRARRGRAPA